MEAARTGKAGIERGIEHARGFTQAKFGVFRSEALQKILGGDTRPAAKEPVEMGLAKSGSGGEVAECGLGRMVFVQVTNHSGDTIIIIHGSNLAERKAKPTRFLR